MNISVEGQKYEGKTTLAFFLACRVADRTKAHKVCIFDPKWAFKNRAPFCNGKIRRVDFSNSIDEFEYLTHEPGDAIAFRPRISFDSDNDELMEQDFRDFAEAIQLEKFLKEPPDEPIILLVDEAYNLQKGARVHPVLASANRLATQGKIFIIQAVHAPKEIAPLMRRQMDEFYLFRQNDPLDLDAIQERCGIEVREIVSSLPQHHVVKFEAKSRKYEVWSHPSGWYSNISEVTKRGATNSLNLTEERATA
jgi:hypothetical protein